MLFSPSICILWPLAIEFRRGSLFKIKIILISNYINFKVQMFLCVCVCVACWFQTYQRSTITYYLHFFFFHVNKYLMVIACNQQNCFKMMVDWQVSRQPLLSGQISIYITHTVRSFAFSASSECGFSDQNTIHFLCLYLHSRLVITSTDLNV